MEVLLQVALSGLLLGGIYGLISIGLTLIFGVIRIINFAHGDMLMLAMYATFWLFELLGINPYCSLFVTIPVFFALGVASYKALIKPIMKVSPVMQVFATVGLSIVFQNLALVLWKPDYRTVVTSYTAKTIEIFGVGVGYPRVIAFVVALLATVALFWFLHRTMLGKAIRAVAQDHTAARLVGVNVDRIYLTTMGIGVACVGVAGSLLMPMYYVFPTVGAYFVLVAFVVVVLGGLGNLMGALFGGFVIGLVEGLGGYFIGPGLKEALYFLAFILVLILKPGGLLGRAEAAEVGSK